MVPKKMGAGVSLSLLRRGHPGDDIRLSVIYVPLTREHVYNDGFPISGGSNPTITRKNGSSGGRFLPEFRMVISACARVYVWSNEANVYSHSPDLEDTYMSGVDPSRNMGKGRTASSFIVRGFVELALVAFHADMVFTVLVTGRCLLPVFEIPKPWVLDPDIHMLPTPKPTMGSLDPVEIGKGRQSMGSHGRAHEDIFPMSTLCRRLARKESTLSSGVSGMVNASIGAAVSVILGDAGKTSHAADLKETDRAGLLPFQSMMGIDRIGMTYTVAGPEGCVGSTTRDLPPQKGASLPKKRRTIAGFLLPACHHEMVSSDVRDIMVSNAEISSFAGIGHSTVHHGAVYSFPKELNRSSNGVKSRSAEDIADARFAILGFAISIVADSLTPVFLGFSPPWPVPCRSECGGFILHGFFVLAPTVLVVVWRGTFKLLFPELVLIVDGGGTGPGSLPGGNRSWDLYPIYFQVLCFSVSTPSATVPDQAATTTGCGSRQPRSVLICTACVAGLLDDREAKSAVIHFPLERA